MKPYSRYNRLILAILGAILLPILAINVYMEPVSNELTRMGGYLENHYGWNIPQEHFEFPLFKLADSLDDYSQYFDVVVLGDSFSEDQSHGWQNYLAAQTGLTIITLDINKVEIEDILASQVYNLRPPKLFIYESVERNLISRNQTCGEYIAQPYGYTPPDIELNKLDIEVVKIDRNREFYSFAGLDFNHAINLSKKAFLREFFGINITEVHRFELTKAGMFSSRENDSLLVLTRDFQLEKVSPEQINKAQCSLLNLQNRIRKHGQTEFIVLVFPDKTTAYAPYLRDRRYADMSIIKQIEMTPGLNVAQVIDDLRHAIESGVLDVYLPNDTHCGFYGYELAASAVTRLIRQLSQH